MNPDLEFFLERAFDPVEPTTSKIGRVVVEPNYEASFDEADETPVREQLLACLKAQSSVDDGYEVPKIDRYPLLAKYIRRITFHRDTIEGPWIEVAPPGNWI